MVVQNVVVSRELDAHEISHIVQKANQFPGNVTVAKDGREVDAKSVLGFLSLSLAKGNTIVIKADGDDGQSVVQALAEML